MLSCMSSLYILDINPLLNKSFANISPIQQIIFLLMVFLCKSFLFCCSPSSLFQLLLLLPWKTYPKKYCEANVKELTTHVFFPPRIKKLWYIYRENGILLSNKKNKILSFAKTRMYLEGIVLSEISIMEKDKHHIISLA